MGFFKDVGNFVSKNVKSATKDAVNIADKSVTYTGFLTDKIAESMNIDGFDRINPMGGLLSDWNDDLNSSSSSSTPKTSGQTLASQEQDKIAWLNDMLQNHSSTVAAYSTNPTTAVLRTDGVILVRTIKLGGGYSTSQFKPTASNYNSMYNKYFAPTNTTVQTNSNQPKNVWDTLSDLINAVPGVVNNPDINGGNSGGASTPSNVPPIVTTVNETMKNTTIAGFNLWYILGAVAVSVGGFMWYNKDKKTYKRKR